MEWCDGTTLKIPSLQKLNEGSYQCVISNCAGSQISTAAELRIGKNLDSNQNYMKHLSSILFLAQLSICYSYNKMSKALRVANLVPQPLQMYGSHYIHTYIYICMHTRLPNGWVVLLNG